MSGIAIRPVETSDAEQIAELLRGLGWFEYMEGEASDVTVARVGQHIELCNANESHAMYAAVGGDRIVGYVSVHWLPYLFLNGEEGYVSELFVVETHRGTGVGKRLLDSVVEQAKARGCARLMLITGRHRESYRRGFYAKRGWAEREGMANFVLTL